MPTGRPPTTSPGGRGGRKTRPSPSGWTRPPDSADDLIKTEAGGQRVSLPRRHPGLAICVGLRGNLDPAPWINQGLDSGKTLIAAAADPTSKSHLQWDLGMALYDTMQVSQARNDRAEALRYGEMAADYLEKACPQPLAADNAYLLGTPLLPPRRHPCRRRQRSSRRRRLVRQGPAVAGQDPHRPNRRRGPPRRIAGEHGRVLLGDETAKKALELTDQGLALMEQAVKQGRLSKSTLGVPYGNLAWMHRQLGEKEQAAYFEQMATKSKLFESRRTACRYRIRHTPCDAVRIRHMPCDAVRSITGRVTPEYRYTPCDDFTAHGVCAVL